MKDKREPSPGRRDFLKTAGLGVGIAAIAGTALTTEKAEAKPQSEDRNGAGYQETDHVRKYYELARF